MAVSMILVLLTQAWMAWCFRLEATVNRGISPQDELSQANPPFREGRDAPPAEERSTLSSPDHAAVQKQVEWYLGDENLHHDKFFHGKISADPEGWLEVKFILTCNRIKAMGVTREEDVLAAVKGSSKVEVKKGEDGAFIRRPNNAPLPKLEPKPKRLVHAHDSGIIVVFANVLAQQNSSMIKDALKIALPLAAKLLFVSSIDDQQRCFCATAPFIGDTEFFKSLTLVVGGAMLRPELCQGDLLEAGKKLLRNHVIEKREKEAQHRQEKRLIIGGTQRFVKGGALPSLSPDKEIIGIPFDGEHSDYNLVKAAYIDPVKVLERVHSILNDQVTLATQAVAQLNASFARAEVTRKIVRYLYQSAKREELREVPIEEACTQLVKFAMSSCELSFGEREWFFKLDLAPAFTAAAWELLGGKKGVKFEQVEASIRQAFEECLDLAMLNKGLWEATRNTFPDAAVHKKVYMAVQKTHRPAFEATMAEMKPEQDLERVQNFFKRWINNSMTKAWASVADAEKVLNVSTVSRLFQNMLSPFGPDDPFSTVPSLLTKDLGPPPKNWALVNNEVKALFKSWGVKTGVEEDQPAENTMKMKEYLDSVMLSTGIWEASHKAFNNSMVSRKIYSAVQKAYREAFDATIMDVKPGEELQQVQEFLKRWISGSMTRAWNYFPDAERVLTVTSVTRLFEHMLAPFGPYDTYSTLPSALQEKIGPLPRNWNLVNDEVKALFSGWRRETAIKRMNSTKVSAMSVGDEAILRVKFGKWKGDHGVKLLEKEEEGWKVSHEEDGYVCVIKWKDIESGKLAFVKANKKGKRTKSNQENNTAAQAAKNPAERKGTEEMATISTTKKHNEDEPALKKAAKGKAKAEKAEARTSTGKAPKEKTSAKRVTTEEAIEKPVEEKSATERAMAEKAGEENVDTSAPKEPADEKAAAEKSAARQMAKKKASAKGAAWKENVAATKAARENSSVDKAAAVEKVEAVENEVAKGSRRRSTMTTQRRRVEMRQEPNRAVEDK